MLLFVAGMLLLAACGGGDERPSLLFTSGNTLYSVRDDGSRVTELARLDAPPPPVAFSPDGRRAAHACRPDADLALPQTALCIKAVETEEVRTVSEDRLDPPGFLSRDGFGGGDIAWDPGSRWVAFLVYRSAAENVVSSGDLYVYDVNADNLRQLDKGEFAAYRGRLRWSPDSGHLAVAETPAIESGTTLQVIDLASGEHTDLTSGQAGVVDQYNWAPDGDRLAMTVNTSVGGLSGNVTLLVVDLQGGHRELPLGPWYPISAAWSPDGRWLAVSAAPAGSSGGFARVFIVAASGGESRDVAPDLASGDYPAWAPDSRRLAFIGAPELGPPDRFPAAALYIVDAGLMEPPRAVSQLHEKVIFPVMSWAPDGAHIFYTADGPPCREGCPPGVLYTASTDDDISAVITDFVVDSFLEWRTD